MSNTDNPEWYKKNKGRAANSFNQRADSEALEAQMDGKPASAMRGHVLKKEGEISFKRDHANQNENQGPDRTPPKPPQPMLTPKGPMREKVDAKVREKQDAIKAKMAQNKQLSRDR